MSGRAWGFPTARQELLLRAALLAGEPALDAWAAWRETADLDTLEAASRRLLPLLYRSLARLGVEHPWMPKLKGVYRHSWSRNQLSLRTLEGVLELLRARGIDFMVLKGAALLADYYKDVGARPMDDVDVIVRVKDAPAAFAALVQGGWRTWSEDPARYVPVYHALNFERGDEVAVDLHWHVLSIDCRERADDAFWQGAVPVLVGRATAKTLDPAAQLVHAIAHGRRWNPLPGIRWIADAVLILRAAPALDWERVVVLARERDLGFVMAESLAYLEQRFGSIVPAAVLARLRARRVSMPWRQFHRTEVEERDPPLLAKVRHTVTEYAWMSRSWAPWQRVALFPRFLKVRAHSDSFGGLARALVKRAISRPL